MDISLKSDGYKIISSGVVLSYGAESNIELFVGEEGDDSAFRIILQFDYDNNDKRTYSRINSNSSDKTIEITCFNFAPEGSTTAEPLNLATVRGKKFLMSFYVSRVGLKSGIRQVVYTFYEG